MTDAVDAVLFDLDDTLCEYRRTSADLLRASFEAVGVEPFFDVQEYYDAYERVVNDDDEHDGMRELREICFANLADEYGRSRDLAYEMADHFAEARDHTNVDPLPGAQAAVEALAEDHALGVVTNGAPEMQRRKLSALEFSDTFQTVVFAGYDAPAKPEPDAYYAALDDLGTTADRAVHVGNSLQTDVPGAHAAGVRSAWLHDGTTEPDPEPHFTVERLDELATPPWRN
ncbi:HAD family hydrolase [Halorubellus sp. JP-L1]|uniref:HAD family hydrolase n=1 Tax=Halorubellus sp. JP-L1 TaxID=2715753 RepID=UPI00140978DD|nr:HAD family hydrolase [Halorubellus sp. JP-L1]NHN41478.1 HAD family hydrolase [Halorubellus sp. JP-L1]